MRKVFLLGLTVLLSFMLQEVNPKSIRSTLIAGTYANAETRAKPRHKKDRVREVRTVWVTAYSSTPEETDDTPFITAMGTRVRHGIIATNLLPFRTRVKIPRLFGERVFVVEDRMHERKKNNVDIWMASKKEALQFGSAYTQIVVLD